MMDATAAVGAEVFVVDKGWERSVGDWRPNDRFPSGLLALSQEARRRGMGFGVWCGWGNADPRSPVALRASRLAGHLAWSHPGAQLRQPRSLSRSRPGPRLGPGRAEPDGHRLRSHLAAARLRDHRPLRLDRAHPRSRRRGARRGGRLPPRPPQPRRPLSHPGAGELLERRTPPRPGHDQEPPHHDHRGPLPDPLQQPGEGRPRPLSAAGLAERLHGRRRPADPGSDRTVRDRRPVGADGRPGDVDGAEPCRSRTRAAEVFKAWRADLRTSRRSPGSLTTRATAWTRVLATLADGRALVAVSAPPGSGRSSWTPASSGPTCCGTSGRAPRAHRTSTARRG